MSLDAESLLSSLAGQALTREAADAWLARLGTRLGLPDLGLDDDDSAAIAMDGLVMVLSWTQGTPALIATIDIGPARHLAPGQLLAMLRGNGNWQTTAGGTLGIDPNGERILFARAVLPLDEMLERADADLAQLADVARAWRVAIAAYIGDAPEPGPALPQAPMLKV